MTAISERLKQTPAPGTMTTATRSSNEMASRKARDFCRFSINDLLAVAGKRKKASKPDDDSSEKGAFDFSSQTSETGDSCKPRKMTISSSKSAASYILG